MLEYLWEIFKTIGGWLLDLLLWVFEFLYAMIGEWLQWLFDLVGALLVRAMEAAKEYIPDDVMGSIIACYEWLEWIDEWVPISFGLKLLAAYFGIMITLSAIRWLFKVIPGMGG